MAKLAVLAVLVLVGCGGYSEFDDTSSSKLLNETGGVSAVAVTQDVSSVGGSTWTSTVTEAVGGADVAATTEGFGGEPVVAPTTGGTSSTGGVSAFTGGTSVATGGTVDKGGASATGGTAAGSTAFVAVPVDCSSENLQTVFNPEVTCRDFGGDGTCSGGVCVECPYDYLDCDGDPRNGCEVLRDVNNCNFCGDKCLAGTCHRFGESVSGVANFTMGCLVVRS